MMNDYQKRRFATNFVHSMFNTVSGKKIAMLDWAFRKNTNDIRESAAICIADQLLDDQAQICVYDPKVPAKRMYADLNCLQTRSIEENRRLQFVENNPYSACNDAHAIAVITEWDEFTTLDWQKIFDSMKNQHSYLIEEIF